MDIYREKNENKSQCKHQSNNQRRGRRGGAKSKKILIKTERGGILRGGGAERKK